MIVAGSGIGDEAYGVFYMTNIIRRVNVIRFD